MSTQWLYDLQYSDDSPTADEPVDQDEIDTQAELDWEERQNDI
jgi:hypothetical protein